MRGGLLRALMDSVLGVDGSEKFLHWGLATEFLQGLYQVHKGSVAGRACVIRFLSVLYFLQSTRFTMLYLCVSRFAE